MSKVFFRGTLRLEENVRLSEVLGLFPGQTYMTVTRTGRRIWEVKGVALGDSWQRLSEARFLYNCIWAHPHERDFGRLTFGEYRYAA